MPKFKKSRGYVQKNNPFKMYKSPAKVALKGNQDKLPMDLQKEILASPGKMTGSPLHQTMEDFVPAFEGADVSEQDYKREQIIDLEDRIGDIKEDIFNQEGGATAAQKKAMAELRKQLAKLRG